MSLVERAKTLISQFRAKDMRVVYAVLNNWERDILVAFLSTEGIETSSHWDISTETCVISHADLYALSQPSSGLLDPGVVVICEVDNHYSFEFALSMICLIYGARNIPAGDAHVLTISHQDAEENLCKLLELLAYSHAELQQFQLGYDGREQDLDIHYCDDSSFLTSAGVGFCKMLEQNRDVLFFCGPHDFTLAQIAEDGCLKRNITGLAIDVADKRWPVSSFIKVLKKDATETLMLCGQDIPCLPVPVIYVVKEPGRIPFPIKDLGLLVVCRHQSNLEFDTATSHIAHNTVERSDFEIEDAMAHAYLSGGGAKTVFIGTNAPAIGISRLQMPRRRLENYQSMAFLFELLHHCRDVPLNDILECLVTDVNIVSEMLRRLQLKQWIMETSHSPRGYAPQSTARARDLKSLLPLFEYNFRPAAFLAGFGNDEPESLQRIAIRIAAIVQRGPELVTTWNPAGQAQQQQLSFKQALFGFYTSVGQACQLPPQLLTRGSVWLKLAAWHMFAKEWDGFQGPFWLNEVCPQKANLDIFRNNPAHFGCLELSIPACVQVDQLVRSLERHRSLVLQTSPQPLVSVPGGIERIEDELLNVWLDRLHYIVLDSRILFDHVAMSTVPLRPESFTCFAPAGVPETSTVQTSKGFYVVALKISKTFTISDGRVVLPGPDELVVIPQDAMERWCKRTGQDILEMVQTRFVLRS